MFILFVLLTRVYLVQHITQTTQNPDFIQKIISIKNGMRKNGLVLEKNILSLFHLSFFPSDHFLHTMAATPTLSQDIRTLTLDDKHFQIFNKLREKLQDVLMAVKAITAVCKKGQSGMADADTGRIGGE